MHVCLTWRGHFFSPEDGLLSACEHTVLLHLSTYCFIMSRCEPEETRNQQLIQRPTPAFFHRAFQDMGFEPQIKQILDEASGANGLETFWQTGYGSGKLVVLGIASKELTEALNRQISHPGIEKQP